MPAPSALIFDILSQGFNVGMWKAKCRCKCSSLDHSETPPYRCKACSCGRFQSDFLCVVCDKHWEDHATVSETEAERKARGLPVGTAFFPLADHSAMQQQVLQKGANTHTVASRSHGQVYQAHASAEKSVAIMPTNCGGLSLTPSAALAVHSLLALLVQKYKF
jgi:hypothetical protein